MDRRHVIQTLGLGLTSTLAGCTGGSTDRSDDPTPTPTGPKEPVPGNAKIANIQSITETEMELGIHVPAIHREVTLELVRHTPTKDDPGTWKLYRINFQPRPILTFESEGTPVSKTKVEYTGHSTGGYLTVDFPAKDEPKGRPLIYGVNLIEHTLDDQRRQIGYTPILVRRKDTGEFIYQEPNGGGTVRGFGYHDIYEYTEAAADNEKTITVTSASTESRWLVPRHDDVPNRKAAVSGYRKAWYERPWSLQYTITDEEYEWWVKANKYDYSGHTADPGTDYRNLDRIYTDYFTDNEPLARVAKVFNETAEQIGLVTPLGKLRFVCDFVQWMPYRDDKSLPQSKPRVQTPTTTLYELAGDCEDKVALTAGLLYQDAFPDYDLATFYVDDPGHVGLAVRKDIFETDIDSIGNNQNYLYADVTYPAPLGTIAEGWSTPRVMRTYPPGHHRPKK